MIGWFSVWSRLMRTPGVMIEADLFQGCSVGAFCTGARSSTLVQNAPCTIGADSDRLVQVQRVHQNNVIVT